MKVYVASSWRNTYQSSIVEELRRVGCQVYDFRKPSTGGPKLDVLTSLSEGFRWSDIAPDWKGWDAAAFRDAVTTHRYAEIGFRQDAAALAWCDTCVLVMPAGRSAHLEAGWAVGAGKRLVILLLGELEPELMYRFADRIVLSLVELVEVLKEEE